MVVGDMGSDSSDVAVLSYEASAVPTSLSRGDKKYLFQGARQ
jgi:hypothetical protein